MTAFSIDTIRVAYIRSLREKAAGRGGAAQEELTLARIRESNANSTRVEMANLEKAKQLIDVSTIEPVLRNLAAQANTSILAAGAKIVEAVESKYGIRLGEDDVSAPLGASLRDLADYPRELARALGEDGGGVSAS
ncbi:hypothetical protein CCP3SC15_1740006 [Gammaproteobacteria bacterium]